MRRRLRTVRIAPPTPGGRRKATNVTLKMDHGGRAGTVDCCASLVPHLSRHGIEAVRNILTTRSRRFRIVSIATWQASTTANHRVRTKHSIKMKSTYLIMGEPGIGKTTLIRQVVSTMRLKASGFYTEDLRERGIREGFRLVTLDGETALLASAGLAAGLQ